MRNKGSWRENRMSVYSRSKNNYEGIDLIREIGLTGDFVANRSSCECPTLIYTGQSPSILRLVSTPGIYREVQVLH